MTLLIASFFAKTVHELAAKAARAWEDGADAVEARLDSFEGDPQSLADLLRSQPERTWIMTCRGQAEGGLSEFNALDRASFLAKVVGDTGAWVDFELADWLGDSNVRSTLRAALGTRFPSELILLIHDFRGGQVDFCPQVEEILRLGAVAKVAYQCPQIHDSFHALDLMHRYGPRVCAIGMGEHGAWTRVLAKKLGAFGTYASLNEASETASGQWPLPNILTNLRWETINSETRLYGVWGIRWLIP